MLPYAIRLPVVPAVPIVVSIPHTGTYILADIAANLASDAMRELPMTDWHLHHLYDFLPLLGVTTIYATWSRFVADMNRPPVPRELYPGRFETGLVATETFWGDTIWQTPPDAAEIERRRRLVHAPYHAALARLLREARGKFGRVTLIDAHSVASRASKLHAELTDDIYLGDRDGASNSGALTEIVENHFLAAGFKVVRNAPYKGGYITDNYGRWDNVEALQIEMCQRLYMEEDDPQGALRQAKFSRIKAVLFDLFRALCAGQRRITA